LLSRYGANFLSSLAVVKRSCNRLWPMINIEMPGTICDSDKREIRRARAEFSLLFRRLDVAECIEGAHMPPADRRGIFGNGDFRLPDKSVDVMSQAHGWWFVGRPQCVE